MSSSHWRAMRESSMGVTPAASLQSYTRLHAPNPVDVDLHRLVRRVGVARLRVAADEPPIPHRDARVDLRLHRAAGDLGHLLPHVRAPAAAAAQAPLRSRAHDG